MFTTDKWHETKPKYLKTFIECSHFLSIFIFFKHVLILHFPFLQIVHHRDCGTAHQVRCMFTILSTSPMQLNPESCKPSLSWTHWASLLLYNIPFCWSPMLNHLWFINVHFRATWQGLLWFIKDQHATVLKSLIGHKWWVGYFQSLAMRVFKTIVYVAPTHQNSAFYLRTS